MRAAPLFVSLFVSPSLELGAAIAADSDATAMKKRRRAAQDDACRCPVCLHYTKQVLLCVSGHSCCPLCEKELRKMGVSMRRCPECRGRLLAESPANPRLLSALEFRRPCRNVGCPQLALITAPERHEAVCGFRVVACPNAANGCTERMLAKDEAQHGLACPFREVACPHAGCTDPPMLKRDLPAHLHACPHRPWACAFCAASVPHCAVLGHFKVAHGIDADVNGTLPLCQADHDLRFGMVLRHAKMRDVYACVTVSCDPGDAYSLEVKAFRRGAAFAPTVDVQFELTPYRGSEGAPRSVSDRSSHFYVVRSGSAPLVLPRSAVFRGALPGAAAPSSPQVQLMAYI